MVKSQIKVVPSSEFSMSEFQNLFQVLLDFSLLEFGRKLLLNFVQYDGNSEIVVETELVLLLCSRIRLSRLDFLPFDGATSIIGTQLQKEDHNFNWLVTTSDFECEIKCEDFYLVSRFK